MPKTIKVLLLGQPNVGKSSLFNTLTKAHVEVGNWPGKTVVVHKGEVSYRDYRIVIYDLPGIYGFTTLTQEELVAREALLLEKPDVVVVIVDSTIPERTMNLAVQVLELTGRVVIVFSKTDLAHGKGIHVNYEGLARELGVPVVPVSIAGEFEAEELLETIVRASSGVREPLRVDYGLLNEYITAIEDILSKTKLEYPARWVALRLLEGDRVLWEQVKQALPSDSIKAIEDILEEVNRLVGDPAEKITEARFKFIESIASKHIAKAKIKASPAPSLLYKPVVGLTVAVGLYLLVFTAVFALNTGFPLNVILSSLGLENAAALVEEYSLSGLIDKGFSLLTGILEPLRDSNPALYSFIADGVVGGVAGILVFLPLILIVVLIQVVIEDSGLAPRLAVASHSLFSKIGASGHAFFPFMLGFGCNVPAIMATRTNPNSLERLRLILTLSFIPCQARLVVLLAFTAAVTRFFSGLIIAASYILAIAAFILVNYALYKLSRSGEREPQLLMEVPALHKPLARVVYWKTAATVKHFLRKAGFIIFTASIVFWFLMYFTPSLEYTEDINTSIAAQLSRSIEVIVAPLGITGASAWIASLAVIVGFIAKELVVSAMLIATGSDTMRDAMALIGLSDPQLLSLAVFVTLYVPCLATIATIYSETRSLKWTLLAVAISLSVAYVFASLVGLVAMLAVG
ncbi:MAG: ferrous iron transport protein B [Desulfurococcus sp.]|nr:ferrous iron transport protein B [Desulfurococcus sp.]